MKSLTRMARVLLLSLITTAAFSQTPAKPAVFAAFPNIIHCNTSEFSNAFIATEGQQVQLSFDNNFRFTGTVISNVTKYGNLQSVLIQSGQSDRSIFHLSRQMLEDHSITYTGRIMSNAASDGYQVKKSNDGNYTLEKIESGKVLQDCHLN